MKFLCPQCKAKYRIADEKLAQRASSRMKCRKCGHVIDIHSAVVPDSNYPPGMSSEAEDTEDEAPRQDVPRVAPTPATAATSASTTGTARRAPAAAAPKRPVPVPKRAGAAPPRRGGIAAVAQAVTPAPTEEDVRPVEPEPPLPSAPLTKAEFEEELPTRIHDGAALTAAFSFAVGQSTTAAVAAPATSDEWYIGIDGAPIGPLGLPALREKAALGKATLESLVWKDGFEEWKPLRDFPELVALVEEARRGAPPAETPDLRTVPAPSPLDLEKAAPLVSETPDSMLEQIGAKPRKSQSHPAAWAAIIVALALGVTIGAVLLSKTQTQEVVKYVEVPASAKADPGAVGGDTVIEEAKVSGETTKHLGGGAPKAETSAAPVAVAAKGLNGLNGLSGINALGPSSGQGPDVAGPGNAPGGQLDGASISRVVNNFTSSVRRGCWDSALSARAPDAPSSARVGVTITIGASGSVDNVTTTGDPKGYPNLAHCIESKVRAWRFPRSGGTTTAQVPFVFAAQ